MIAHGVNNHGGKRANEMGCKNHRLRLESVALGRSRYCLLISVVQLEANRQADVLVDTLHRASVLWGNMSTQFWRAICLPPSTSPQESPKEVFSALSSSLSTLMTSLTIFKTIQLLNFLPTTPSSTTPSTTNKTL